MRIIILFALLAITTLSCKEKDQEVKILDLSGTKWKSNENTSRFEYFTELSFSSDTITIRNMSQDKNALTEKYVYMMIYPRFFANKNDGSLIIGELTGSRINFRGKTFELIN